MSGVLFPAVLCCMLPGMGFSLLEEAVFAYRSALDRWERTEQTPSEVGVVLLSREEMVGLLEGEGLLLDVLRRDIVRALDRAA